MAYENNFNNNNGQYQNNGQNNRKSVNTRGNAYYNSTQAVPCCLSVTYWDNMVKLGFAPMLPESQQTVSRKYDHENEVFSTMTRIKAQTLYTKYKEVIIPALQEAKEESISVTVGGVNQIQIAVKVDAEGAPHPCVRLIKAIGENLKAADENIFEYEFNTTEIVYGYDPKNGTFTKREFIFTELELFMRDLNSAVEASSNAYVHTDRVVQKYMTDRTDNKLNQIGAKLGIDLETSPRFSAGGRGGQGSIFDGPSNTQSVSGYEVPTNSVGSIEELNAVIG